TPSSSGSSPIAPMPPTEWRPRPESSSRSCASRLAKSALPCIPGAGWSNASWPGSGATAASPRTSKERSSRHQPSSMPLPSCCSHDALLVRFKIRVGLLDEMSFQFQRVLLIAAVRRSLENDEQWDHEERRDHQQLVIVDVGDDLRLLRDHGVATGASGCGDRIP